MSWILLNINLSSIISPGICLSLHLKALFLIFIIKLMITSLKSLFPRDSEQTNFTWYHRIFLTTVLAKNIFSRSFNVIATDTAQSMVCVNGRTHSGCIHFFVYYTISTLCSLLLITSTRYLVFYNPSPPRMFLSLDLLSEYRIQHGAIGPLYVTSSYSTWIFCRGVSGFATDCPCSVWCRGLTACLLHVGPPFENRFLNNSGAVSLT